MAAAVSLSGLKTETERGELHREKSRTRSEERVVSASVSRPRAAVVAEV